MYSIFPRSVFWALWLVAGWVVGPAMAEVDGEEAGASTTFGAPLVFGGTKPIVGDDTPPAPIAAPVTSVTIMPDHLLDVQQKLRDHPGQRRAAQRVCEAQWRVLLGQSNFYPRLNATLSGGSKWIDQTTRADEFGGSNSPEYDGEGLNATLTLRQPIFDWGRNRAVIDGYQQDRFVAEIERGMTLDEQLVTLLRMSLQYVLHGRLVAHFAAVEEVVTRDVESMEARYRAGAARLAEMRQARLTALEIESRLTQSERQRDLVGEAMKTQFNIAPQEAEALIDSFTHRRPDVPGVIAGIASPRARLIRHNIDKARAEGDRLKAERRPAFTGVVTARGWDIGHKDRCNDPVERNHPDAGKRQVSGFTGPRYRDQNCVTYE